MKPCRGRLLVYAKKLKLGFIVDSLPWCRICANERGGPLWTPPGKAARRKNLKHKEATYLK